MKSPAAYYLLLIYLAVICKPILPLVQDAIAHTFFKYEHIATVHHQLGSNHVHYEIGKLAKDGSPENTTLKTNAFDGIPLHLTAAPLQIFQPSQRLLAIPFYYDADSHLPAVVTAIYLPPPDVV